MVPNSSAIFPERIFITGTDTDIGKTVVAAVLMTGLPGVYWKPIQSGAAPMTDTDWVREKTGLADDCFRSERYLLKTPVSPHLAAAIENREIALDQIMPPDIPAGRHLVVEGAGGVMVPINDDQFMLDLIKHLDMPALVVAPSRLGMINHTLLSVTQLRNAGIPVLGVVMNGERNPENKKAVEHYGKVPVLAEIEPLPIINRAALQAAFERFL